MPDVRSFTCMNSGVSIVKSLTASAYDAITTVLDFFSCRKRAAFGLESSGNSSGSRFITLSRLEGAVVLDIGQSRP